ncbi:hypothetical protein, partial [Fulvivirga marina]|uniref:hypothetical protein n=1 Tax=Fulvivirga marina TaxID=2494733 RepID=UPI001EE2F961
MRVSFAKYMPLDYFNNTGIFVGIIDYHFQPIIHPNVMPRLITLAVCSMLFFTACTQEDIYTHDPAKLE